MESGFNNGVVGAASKKFFNGIKDEIAAPMEF